ncbi:MAG: aminotransferase class V-fold PLP-dependent enzyme [Planctomycetota bacterium]|jgi:selenocysteine lyase/cysteine desulfurase
MSSKAEVIYLDHAATSWPKPPEVAGAIERFMGDVAANAGRSGHGASLRSARMVFDVRERAAELLGVRDSADLVFTRGTTEGLNLVLKGFLSEGDRVLVTPMEHNSAMRPLTRLAAERSVRVAMMPADEFGRVDVAAGREMTEGRAPQLVVVNHVSNVNGAVQDLGAVREAFPESALLVDAAQSVGVLPVDVAGSRIDFLCCSAHKGLLGPTGLGLCYLDPRHEVRPLAEGGTGSASEETRHPGFRPDRYEAGTLNLHGIAGLGGALEHIAAKGLLGEHKRQLTSRLIEGLREISGVRLHSPGDGSALMVSLTAESMAPDALARRLEEKRGVLCRPGLQCSPSAHRHLGTFSGGTLRLSPGFGNSAAQVEQVLEGLGGLLAGR